MKIIAIFALACLLMPEQMLPASADVLEDLKKQEQALARKQQLLEAKLARKKKIFYCVQDIQKGKRITAQQVEDRDLEPERIPGDAVLASVVGRVPVFDITAGSVISTRDFGTALTKAQIEAMTARNYQGQKGAMKKIVFAKTPIVKGTRISADQIAEYVMPEDLMPMDALNTSLLVQGRKCKYGIGKFQIIMMHDLDILTGCLAYSSVPVGW